MDQQQKESSFLTGSPAPSQDDKTMALIAHIGGIIVPILVPLIIMVTKGEKSSWVKAQAVEALNFQIGVFIAYVICSALTLLCIGALLFPIVGLAAVIMGIMAGLKVNEGVSYRYPFSIRLIK
ncbi:DUF4870 domain-containing protein [Hyalangium sp.]|uniref:DUF4870 domain-containing protein n=1 Tax=Hyalangium sp. TaxID=2028555 RepID=UPI002D7226DB|nr:DUF4870 domain-containing protein [Hyalangium sp.]HYH96940.1 DUF4870 domain-containing protein [Hyalangium sp.]